MSYQVLARKWRPQNFQQLVGQEHVLRALVNALESQRLHHAYLFTGTRGVGKTTIARILARALNCETGITATPCGTCNACMEISEGRFVDLIEVDAASRTKVEDTRDLLENVQYRPTGGRFKIYLIDEVHMLSNHSFNALLKTLEEPPEHVKFLLATTDPQKLPVTVLSRCLQFNLKNLPSARIAEYLEDILGREKIPFETTALMHLARAAQGSMRDGLSLTDQAISHGAGKLAEQDVVDMLGTVDRKRLFQLLEAILNSDGEGLLAVCRELAQYSIDYFALLEELLGLLHAIVVQQLVPDSDHSSFDDPQRIVELATRISHEDAQLFYQMLLIGRRDLSSVPDLHLGFEMLMLRLLAFQPAGNTSHVRLPDESASSAVPKASDPPSIVPDEGVPPVKKSESAITEEWSQVPEESPSFDSLKADVSPTSEPSPPVMEDTAANHALRTENDVTRAKNIEVPAYISNDTSSVTDREHVEVQHSVSAEVGMAAVSGESNTANVASSEQHVPRALEALNEDNWITLYQHLQFDGVLKSVASHMVLSSVNQDHLAFTLGDAGRGLFSTKHAQRLESLLTSYFSSPVRVSIELGEPGRETPAECAQRMHAEELQAAEVSMRNTPLVMALMQEFDVTLAPNSIEFDEPNH